MNAPVALICLPEKSGAPSSSFQQNAGLCETGNRRSRKPIFVLCAATAQGRPDAAPAFDLKEHYTKYEAYIPMRDGKKLFTSIYVPKDTSHPYPFLMTRTPYSVSPYGVDQFRRRLGPSDDFDKAGYI